MFLYIFYDFYFRFKSKVIVRSDGWNHLNIVENDVLDNNLKDNSQVENCLNYVKKGDKFTVHLMDNDVNDNYHLFYDVRIDVFKTDKDYC